MESRPFKPCSAGLLRRSGLILGLALALLPASLHSSAFAAVAAHEMVSKESAVNSSNKTVTATCPAGKKLVGTGGEIITFGSGQVSMAANRPNSDLASVVVSTREDESGFDANWGLIADAVCATPPPGLQRIAATSASNSSNKSVTATCPAGKKVLGAAGEITPATGQVSMAAIRPNSTLTSVTVQGLEDGTTFAGSWSVTAYAICAIPPAGLQRVPATSGPNSSNKDVFATCPAGKGVVGTGGEITGGAGQVVLEIVAPTPAADPVSVGAVAAEDQNGFAGTWRVTAYAICAAVSKRVVATSLEVDSSSSKAAIASCPSGRQLTGGGGEITGGVGQVSLNALYPLSDSLISLDAHAFEDGTGFAGNWFVRAYAICATPLPGLALSSAETSFDTDDNKGTTAPCPMGKRTVGASYDIVADGEVVPAALSPGIETVTAHAYEDDTGSGFAWRLISYAICATPPSGLTVVVARSPFDWEPKSVTARCPSGKNVLGAGAQIDPGTGQVILDDLRPNDLLTSVTATAMVDETGIGSDWRLTAYAICANP